MVTDKDKKPKRTSWWCTASVWSLISENLFFALMALGGGDWSEHP